MKIAYITAEFPYGAEDPFLSSEIAAMAELGADVVIVPAATAPRGARPLDAGSSQVLSYSAAGAQTLVMAAAQAFAARKTAWTICRAVLFGSYAAKEKRRNAGILLKSFAIARALQPCGVQHIHAQRTSLPSTIAYVVSNLTGIPWSCTARWIDVAENNLSASKAASAAFVRAVGPRTRAQIVRLTGGAIDGRCTIVPPALHEVPRLQKAPAPAPLRIACFCDGDARTAGIVKRALEELREQFPLECDLIADGARHGKRGQRPAGELAPSVKLRSGISHDRFYAELRNGAYGIALFAGHAPEYMAAALLAGVPCIVTGDPDDLIDEDCVTAVAPEPGAICTAVADLYRNSARCLELRERAMQRAKLRFDALENGRALLRLMQGAR